MVVSASPFLFVLCLPLFVSLDVVIDLKVLVRSFNYESRACYVGNPRESFFRENKILFRESWVL